MLIHCGSRSIQTEERLVKELIHAEQLAPEGDENRRLHPYFIGCLCASTLLGDLGAEVI